MRLGWNGEGEFMTLSILALGITPHKFLISNVDARNSDSFGLLLSITGKILWRRREIDGKLEQV